MNSKSILLSGIFLSFLAVLIGAFGSHALLGLLEKNNRINTFETGAKYHFYHSLGLILIGILSIIIKNSSFDVPAILMIVGTVIFSGSLYLLSITNITTFGIITPIGGVSLIIAWIYTAIIVYKSQI
ncbi:MAG: DUF423 domain-containing protein [Flammeovirgaceae bacterium]|nr:DUF423 domain-containing protein [Flammeovirgaceae bacterium]